MRALIAHLFLPRSRRNGISHRGVIFALAAVSAVSLAVWLAVTWISWTSTVTAGPVFHQVTRSEFVHSITGRGETHSAASVEVICEVDAPNSGGAMLLEIVPVGTQVEKGDFLARFDSSALEARRTQQLIICNGSKAALAEARSTHETELLAKKEYLEGIFKQEEELLLGQRFVAQENLRRAEEYAKYSESLAAKGYVTQAQLEADQFAVENYRKQLDAVETQLSVLRTYTREKTITELDSAITTGAARLSTAELNHQLDLEELARLETQITNCEVHSPAAGQVVYAHNLKRKGESVIIEEGRLVREGQVFIHLPDPTKMQVTAPIDESQIYLIQPGMRVTIKLDAFPDLVLTGTVDKVAKYTMSSSYESIKEYATAIEIENPPAEVRPGMTAEVTIHVEHLSGVLQIPVQAAVERRGKHYCLVKSPSGMRRREILIGSTNDEFVVVRDGLSEQDQVVMNAQDYFDDWERPGEFSALDDELRIGPDEPKLTDAAANTTGGNAVMNESIAASAGDRGATDQAAAERANHPQTRQGRKAAGVGDAAAIARGQ